MKKTHPIIALLAIALNINSSGPALADISIPVIPPGFNIEYLNILACPENLTPLHFASESELLKVNSDIGKKLQKTWGGKIVLKPVEAILVRKDNKIGYRIDAGIPIMLVDEALVLDPSIGKPDPEKNRAH